MRSGFLTTLRLRRENRRTAIWMSLTIAVMAGSQSARADEPAPASLMTRALRYNGYDEATRGRALEAAPWLPVLRVHAVVERTPSLYGYQSTQIMGELAWPLGRTPALDAIAEAQTRRLASVGRQRLLDHIADVWRRRQHARDQRDDVSRRLAAEETQAELDALTGDRDRERGP